MDTHDVIIVGSGAGGAPLARELAKAGKSVLVLEQGKRRADTSRAIPIDIVTSLEGVPIMRAITGGGTTEIAAGNMVPCLESELGALGVDITSELAVVAAEIGAAPLDPSLRHEASLAIQKGAADVGLRFEPIMKCIDASLCDGCGTCLKGCSTGARWSASIQLAQAEGHGATVLYDAECTRAISNDGRVVGVEACVSGSSVTYHAPCVVFCAGGLATPVLLMASGIEAGRRLSVDLLTHVYGFVRGASYPRELPMPLVCTDMLDERGFILSPNINYGAVARHVREHGPEWASPSNALGLMIKIKDSAEGKVHPDGTVSKAVSAHDREVLNDAVSVAHNVLAAAGVDEETFFETIINGAHPLGTAAIGDVVSSSLETRVKGLYVCDASVLPTAPGLPPIMTIMALALRLADHIIRK